jgi:Zn-dependent oligopeptidase
MSLQLNENKSSVSFKHLYEKSSLPYAAIPFDRMKAEDFLPALKFTLSLAENELQKWRQSTGPDNFKTTILALEEIKEPMTQLSRIFFNLHHAECTPEIEKSAPEFSALLTRFQTEMTLDPVTFKKIKNCWQEKDRYSYSAEELRIIDETYKGFVRNGALACEEDKAELKQIDQSLADLSLQFSQNVLKATHAEWIVLEDKDLVGLPESLKEAMSEIAEKKGQHKKFVLTLDYPILTPFLTYSQRRDLRKKIYDLHVTKAFGGPYDNIKIVADIIKFRKRRAEILGFSSHAHFTLSERMAETPEKVESFLNQLIQKALPFAKKEIEQVKKIAKELDQLEDLQKWDFAYYTEKLKQKTIQLDEQQLRPYFSLENVISGVVLVAQKLYGLSFKEKVNYPTYHPDVKVFEVFEEKNKKFMGLFYMDFFPRETKKGGAWMTTFLDQGTFWREVQRPHVGIVCNFTKPTKTKPSLLSLDEVTTLFHEFGHALHALCSDCKYTFLSGTNVYWDFVELPSQIMENWVYEKDCLDLFARHYETQEPMPQELIEKIKLSGNFMEGNATLRQLQFALLDMSYHGQKVVTVDELVEHETKIVESTSLLPTVTPSNMSCAFSHVFAGGYSAGYYSYKWAEVLDADAFEAFKDEGLFNQSVAKRFKDNILSRGGTEHPMVLYKKFRGREPSVDALLKRAGLVSS